MRTNAPDKYYHEVDGGAPALLGPFVVVDPAVVSLRSPASSGLRDDEYEVVTS